MFLIMNFLFWFFISFFAIETIAYFLLEIGLFVYIFFNLSNYYQKYSNNFFLKLSRFNSLSKNNIKSSAFLAIFLYGLIYIFVWLILIFLYSKIPSNFINNNFGRLNDPLNWNSIEVNIYFYLSISELMIMMFFSYFVNHFIKKQFLLSFVLSIFLIWSIFFGNLNRFLVRFINEENISMFYWNEGMILPNWFVNTNSIFMPWTQFGLLGINIFRNTESYYLNSTTTNWFELIQLIDGDHWIFYQYINWIGYLWILPYFIIPQIFKRK